MVARRGFLGSNSVASILQWLNTNNTEFATTPVVGKPSHVCKLTVLSVLPGIFVSMHVNDASYFVGIFRAMPAETSSVGA